MPLIRLLEVQGRGSLHQICYRNQQTKILSKTMMRPIWASASTTAFKTKQQFSASKIRIKNQGLKDSIINQQIWLNALSSGSAPLARKTHHRWKSVLIWHPALINCTKCCQLRVHISIIQAEGIVLAGISKEVSRNFQECWVGSTRSDRVWKTMIVRTRSSTKKSC